MSSIKKSVRALLACVAIAIFSGHSVSYGGSRIWPVETFITPDKGEMFPYSSKIKEEALLPTLESDPTGHQYHLCMILRSTHINIEEKDHIILYIQDLIRLALLCEEHHPSHREKPLSSCFVALVLVPDFLESLDPAERESLPVNDTLLKALRYEGQDRFLEGHGEEGQGIPQFEDSPTGLMHAVSWMLHCLSPHVLFGWTIPSSICEADEEERELAVGWSPFRAGKKVCQWAMHWIGRGADEEAKHLTFNWSPVQAWEKPEKLYQQAMRWIEQWGLCDTEYAPHFWHFLSSHDSIEVETIQGWFEGIKRVVQESGLPVIFGGLPVAWGTLPTSSITGKEHYYTFYVPLHKGQVLSETDRFWAFCKIRG